MSYSFDAANDRLTGTMGTTYSSVCTLACYVKVAAHPIATGGMVNFGAANNSVNDSNSLRTVATDNAWRAVSVDSGGTANTTGNRVQDVDGVWAGLVGKFTNSTSRTIYVQALANSTENATSITVANTLQFVHIGELLSGAGDFGTGLLAEIAIWNSLLSDGDITSYMDGTSASLISPANLIGYWPLSADGVLTNEGVDTAGDLTASGAVFNADHPTITGAGTARKRRQGLMGVG